MLTPYPVSENGKNRKYLKNKYKVSLFGIPLQIKSVPYQVQDRRVSACATVALWTSINAISHLFETKKHSPVEITELATQTPSISRIFPQTGLNAVQIVRCLQMLDLDAQIIGITGQTNDVILKTAVRAFLEFGIPIIAGFQIWTNGAKTGAHAVVITGYQHDANGEITELYVHDDQIGPYCRVKSNGNFLKWNYEWSGGPGVELRVDRLIIPVYHKIRADFVLLFSLLQTMLNAPLPEELPADTTRRLLLISLNDYKKFLLSRNINNKLEKLTINLPRFLWIIRTQHEESIYKDDIFDGTAVYPSKLTSVLYEADE